MRIGIIGCGWLGWPLAKALIERGHSVVGTTTRPEKRDRLTADGIDARLLDLDVPIPDATRTALRGCNRLFVNVPPGRRHADVETRYPEWMRGLLTLDNPQIDRWVFASSTGVYGVATGRVDEATPCEPRRASARALLAAERLLNSALNGRLCTLRLAGLAGGEREPGRWLAGRTELPQGQAPVNLLHRHDAVQLVRHVLESGPLPDNCYNCCAPVHPAKVDYYPARARRLGLAPPTFRAGGSDSKVVDGARIRTVLGYRFRYPDPATFPLESSQK